MHNICELYEKQSDLQECIRDARTLLNSIHDASYTVLTDIKNVPYYEKFKGENNE